MLLINGTVMDPASGLNGPAEVLLEDGRVKAVGTGLPRKGVGEIIDCTNAVICPGLIDMHVHLREPGQEGKETIATGSAAAVAGGFTTICCMPNTTPALDNDAQINFIFNQAERANLCRVLPFGALTKGRKGEELAEIRLMLDAGAIGFSDDGVGIGSAAVMQKCLQYLKMYDGLLSQHCEEPTLSGGPMNAGPVATRLGLAGLPAAAEELMIARDLLLNQNIGARYHVQHISTRGAVDLIRQAKARGQKVTCEVSPHHLLLTDECCASYNSNYKMNPPLRTHADVEACIQGVKDGTIDALATDHAPHMREEKELEFDKAPFGIIGLETALGLYHKALVKPGHITLQRMLEMMTVAPARILKLPELGALTAGMEADVTIFEPNTTWTIDVNAMRSKSRNTPFDGWQVQCKIRTTIVGGRVVYQA